MASKNASIGVELIGDDELQILKQAAPTRVVRKDPLVELVWVAENNSALRSYGRSSVLRSISVVGVDPEIRAQSVPPTNKIVHLVVRQSLCRIQIQGSGILIANEAIENWKVVAE